MLRSGVPSTTFNAFVTLKREKRIRLKANWITAKGMYDDRKTMIQLVDSQSVVVIEIDSVPEAVRYRIARRDHWFRVAHNTNQIPESVERSC